MRGDVEAHALSEEGGAADSGDMAEDGPSPIQPSPIQSSPIQPSPTRPSSARPAPAGEPSDSELILAIAQHRDKSAFAALFHRYERRLTAFALRSGASPDQAEEAAQEALLTVWRKADAYDPRQASAAAWLFTIARNKRIDMLRRSARAAPDPNDPVFAPEPSAPPAAALSAERRDSVVRAALADLTPEQRRVVELSFFEGRTHRDIAETLQLPLGTVKSRLRLAFARLRDALGEAFRDELSDH